jgi:hypothetical protein
MGLFKKSKHPRAEDKGGIEEHAVIVHYQLTGEEYGTEDEREAVYALEERLEKAIQAAGAGEFDGNEFGDGEAVLYMYGPDKDLLWSVVETEVRKFPWRPAYALLRAGGPETSSEQVHL